MIFPHAAIITQTNVTRRNNEECEKDHKKAKIKHDNAKHVGKKK